MINEMLLILNKSVTQLNGWQQLYINFTKKQNQPSSFHFQNAKTKINLKDIISLKIP